MSLKLRNKSKIVSALVIIVILAGLISAMLGCTAETPAPAPTPAPRANACASANANSNTDTGTHTNADTDTCASDNAYALYRVPPLAAKQDFEWRPPPAFMIPVSGDTWSPCSRRNIMSR